MSRIPALLERTQEIGMEALAMTDHGALYGAIDFYREANARNIKPIIGVESYVARSSRKTHLRDNHLVQLYPHCIFLRVHDLHEVCNKSLPNWQV